MPDVVFSVDQSKSMRDQAVPGHNRWHPDIPPAVTVRPGQSIRVECKEWTDGQILDNDSANDVRDVDLSHVHVLSGPIAVEGAEPGDLLVVDILDLGPVPQTEGPNCGEGWGYSGIFAKVNGGGFLTDYFPDAYEAIRYLEKWGYTGEQAYLILGTSPIEGRIGGVVDIPNACCSVFLPTEIFDEDIRPGGQGPQRQDRGQVCVTS